MLAPPPELDLFLSLVAAFRVLDKDAPGLRLARVFAPALTDQTRSIRFSGPTPPTEPPLALEVSATTRQRLAEILAASTTTAAPTGTTLAGYITSKLGLYLDSRIAAKNEAFDRERVRLLNALHERARFSPVVEEPVSKETMGMALSNVSPPAPTPPPTPIPPSTLALLHRMMLAAENVSELQLRLSRVLEVARRELLVPHTHTSTPIVAVLEHYLSQAARIDTQLLFEYCVVLLHGLDTMRPCVVQLLLRVSAGDIGVFWHDLLTTPQCPHHTGRANHYQISTALWFLASLESTRARAHVLETWRRLEEHHPNASINYILHQGNVDDEATVVALHARVMGLPPGRIPTDATTTASVDGLDHLYSFLKDAFQIDFAALVDMNNDAHRDGPNALRVRWTGLSVALRAWILAAYSRQFVSGRDGHHASAIVADILANDTELAECSGVWGALAHELSRVPNANLAAVLAAIDRVPTVTLSRGDVLRVVQLAATPSDTAFFMEWWVEYSPKGPKVDNSAVANMVLDTVSGELHTHLLLAAAAGRVVARLASTSPARAYAALARHAEGPDAAERCVRCLDAAVLQQPAMDAAALTRFLEAVVVPAEHAFQFAYQTPPHHRLVGGLLLPLLPVVLSHLPLRLILKLIHRAQLPLEDMIVPAFQAIHKPSAAEVARLQAAADARREPQLPHPMFATYVHPNRPRVVSAHQVLAKNVGRLLLTMVAANDRGVQGPVLPPQSPAAAGLLHGYLDHVAAAVLGQLVVEPLQAHNLDPALVLRCLNKIYREAVPTPTENPLDPRHGWHALTVYTKLCEGAVRHFMRAGYVELALALLSGLEFSPQTLRARVLQELARANPFVTKAFVETVVVEGLWLAIPAVYWERMVMGVMESPLLGVTAKHNLHRQVLPTMTRRAARALVTQQVDLLLALLAETGQGLLARMTYMMAQAEKLQVPRNRIEQWSALVRAMQQSSTGFWTPGRMERVGKKKRQRERRRKQRDEFRGTAKGQRAFPPQHPVSTARALREIQAARTRAAAWGRPAPQRLR